MIHAHAFFDDLKHAASICLGTIKSPANVHLCLACQRLLLQIHIRLRITMQHIWSHVQNPGNECEDHAATLGSFGLVPNQNVRTRWAHHSFDSNWCFATCHNLGDVLEKVRDDRVACVYASLSLIGSHRSVRRRVSL